MVGMTAGSQVLLVGDTGARLEGELAVHGVAFAKAPTANDAVARMKTTRFPFVVVSPILADMGGVDFIHGVLRHFDANVVLYGNGVDAGDINALLRTGRVAHFPANVEGHAIADFLARRAGTPTAFPAVGPAAHSGGNGRAPSTPPAFNLTPGAPPEHGPPITTPQAFAGASTMFGGGLASAIPPAPAYAVPRPPTMTPISGVGGLGGALGGVDPRFEQIVDELARTNAELEAARGRIAALDQERAALLVEVEAARRAALADVAQVMALSDEGNAIDSELEEAKGKVAQLEADAGALRLDLDNVRAERERLVAEAASAAGSIAAAEAARAAAEAELAELRAGTSRDKEAADAARAEVERLRRELEEAKADGEAKVALERNARQEAEGNLTKLRLETEEKWTQALAEESERAAAAEDRVEQLERELAEARAAASASAGDAEVAAALRIESEKLRADVAAARTDATTVRLDLQEALLRLEEASTALANVTLERDTLRDEAGPLREWGNALVAEHARVQGELERLRPLAELTEKLEATNRKLERSLLDAAKAAKGGPDVEVFLARSRQLADLVRALEPFTWGLTQATQFYKEHGAAGGEAHLRSLQQLGGVLLRLRDEIAMLDLG